MSDTIHLDRLMTKQELQIENRYFRNKLKELQKLFIDLDLISSADANELHFKSDRMLGEINHIFGQLELNAPNLLARYTDEEPA